MIASFSNLHVWQLAGGPTSRPYADVFLKHGVGLIGPGDSGPWTAGKGDGDPDAGFVRRFASEMRQGDAVLLRTGMATIVAVGIVASPYMHLNQFDDVNGWDLQHARRIRWCPLPREYTFDSQIFGANPSRCSRVWNREAQEFAQRFLNSPPTIWQEAPLPELPDEEPDLDELPPAVVPLVAQAQDLVTLYLNNESFGEAPSEDELVVHYVVPFLRCMGWPIERIAVQWQHIDVAVFSALPRTPQNCRLVVEAKRLGTGVEGALSQALGYVRNLNAPCDVLVTDGIRYRLYSSMDEYAPTAYANLVRLKPSAMELFRRVQKP